MVKYVITEAAKHCKLNRAIRKEFNIDVKLAKVLFNRKSKSDVSSEDLDKVSEYFKAIREGNTRLIPKKVKRRMKDKLPYLHRLAKMNSKRIKG